jgi:putative intracellular protease/amidase
MNQIDRGQSDPQQPGPHHEPDQRARPAQTNPDSRDDGGAKFENADAWSPHVVVDRNLYTGQNPASSDPLAKELLKVLS